MASGLPDFTRSWPTLPCTCPRPENGKCYWFFPIIKVSAKLTLLHKRVKIWQKKASGNPGHNFKTLKLPSGNWVWTP